MQWLAQVCVRRPVFAAVLMLVILTFGVVGYQKLGLDEFPSADFPMVTITTRLAGAAPDEVETDITDKIEGAVNTISGIDTLSSTSAEGVSLVLVQFDLSKDADVGAQEVRDKINGVLADLPKGIDQPIVGRVDPDSAAVLLVALRSNRPIAEVTEVADKQVRRQIENIQGVGQVSLVGGTARQVNVWLDPVALRAQGLTPLDVYRALGSQNLSTPGGHLESGPENLTIRVEGRVSSVAEIGRIIVTERDGHAVRVSDLARVQDGQAEETTFAQVDDERTVVLSVRKQSGQNTVEVVDSVIKRLSEVEQTLPDGMKLDVVMDNSQTIRTGVGAVKEHLVVGAILAALVVMLFLGNVRSTIITALSIPISVIGTFGVMWVAGFTLNFLTLLALALSVGIVIDDAIVVLENIVRYVNVKGYKPFPAAVLATREIGLAVLATTLSLIAVFVPVAFMPGMAGRFLRSFGLTMAFAVAVSMLVSFSLTPSLAAQWLKPHDEHAAPSILERVVEKFYRPIERVYVVMLRWSLAHRWVIFAACAASMATIPLVSKHLPMSFLPQDDTARFEVALTAPEGTSLPATRLITDRIAKDIREIPEVTRTLLTVGEGTYEASNGAKVYVFLTAPDKRPISQVEIMARVRNEILPKLPPDLRVSVNEVSSISIGRSATVQMALQGPDLKQLAKYAGNIVKALKDVPGAQDVDTSLSEGKPELRIAIDRDRAASLGVRVSDLADTMQLFVGGLKASSYSEGGEQYDIRVRAAPQYRAEPATLGLVSVPSSKFGSVSVANLVTTRTDSGPAMIDRIGRRRQITLMANADPKIGESAVQSAVTKIVEQQQLPPGYTITAIGRSKESGRTVAGFLMVIGMAFVFMYLVLAAQFESWLYPITILFSLPLTVPFALVSLLIFNDSLNMFSGLGLLVLFGVVKKNAILQIDHTNQLRASGMARLDAMLQANKDRLRPILMTTLAFVAGMIPLVVSKGIGAGKNHTMGAIVLGGQSLSLLLTLLAVPAAYSVLDDISSFFAKLRNKQDNGEKELAVLLGEEPGIPHP